MEPGSSLISIQVYYRELPDSPVVGIPQSLLHQFSALTYLNVSSLNWASIFVSRVGASTVLTISGVARTLLSS